MFKKPFKVKSNSQLKGSDRKKLRSDITQQFPNLNEDELNNIMPNKETIFSMKIQVHTGEIVTVYLVQKLPIVFELEKTMFPTVYMLWHAPDLLYLFTTHPQVLPVIGRGADLMLPGVVLPGGEGLRAYGNLTKGERVAVNLTSNKAPVAVGKAAHSSHDMYMCARRGKCVEVLHYYGDLLSTYGTKLVIPELGPPFQTKDSDQELVSDVESLVSPTENLQLNGEESSPSSSETGLVEIEVEESDPIIDGAVEVISTPEEPVNTTALMDDLLQYCFLKCIRTTMKKVELPLLTSNFYKLHIISACPKSKTLDVKKTSYKKLSNFLDDMVKKGIIQVESLQKGVQSISKVDFTHELVRSFVDNYANEEDDSGLSVDTTQTNKASVPEITEKYTVTAAVLPLFYFYDYKKKESVTATVVRKVVGDYVRTKNLQSSVNKKLVELDDVLRSATNSSGEVTSLLWDQLVSQVFSQMGHSFKVELSGNEMPLTKGKLQPIDIQVGTRSGNKKVTLVNNLELFGINLTEFARECQHGVAASTTINTLPNAKSAQLQIQGNQVIFVHNILIEKYQIPKRYLRGLENAPKKKK